LDDGKSYLWLYENEKIYADSIQLNYEITHKSPIYWLVSYRFVALCFGLGLLGELRIRKKKTPFTKIINLFVLVLTIICAIYMLDTFMRVFTSVIVYRIKLLTLVPIIALGVISLMIPVILLKK
jgi:hypothetical protein